MKASVFLTVLAASLALFALPDSASSGDGDATVRSVDVRDIGTGVELIGRLGYPLGTFVTVDGTWRFPDQSKGATKDYSLRFIIHRVNDKPLATPVPIDIDRVSVTDQRGSSFIPPHKDHAKLDGVSWKLRAYETGRFTVVPKEYWQFRGTPAMRSQATFASELVGFKNPD